MTGLTWVQIARLGLVQMALGAVVVLTTSTLNRLMSVELALPAVLPGALVALHYGVQISRPHWGFASDVGGRRSVWIVAGMALLGAGALMATAALAVFPGSFLGGLAISLLAYVLIGLGVGACGTSLLALLATATAPQRRAAAATITWLMMIFGIALTATAVGKLIEPYSFARLLAVVAGVTGGALGLTLLAIRGIEKPAAREPARERPDLRAGLAEIWAEPRARAFTLFVLVAMVAYFMQELILEPFAGLVFGLSPGESTALSGVQHGGAFLGMLLVGVAVSGLRIGSLRIWVTLGCLGSAGALVLLTLAPGLALPLDPLVMALGLFNGIFAVSAIGAMMQLAGEGRGGREGTRMGIWGGAQAVAAGAGGLLGAGLADLFRLWWPAPQAFGMVFTIEAGMFLIAGLMALRIISPAPRTGAPALVPGE